MRTQLFSHSPRAWPGISGLHAAAAGTGRSQLRRGRCLSQTYHRRLPLRPLVPRADLAGAYLGGANLEGAHLEGADLEGAHLEGANLQGAHLAGATLLGANLERANLHGAYLEKAVLTVGRLPYRSSRILWA